MILASSWGKDGVHTKNAVMICCIFVWFSERLLVVSGKVLVKYSLSRAIGNWARYLSNHRHCYENPVFALILLLMQLLKAFMIS